MIPSNHTFDSQLGLYGSQQEHGSCRFVDEILLLIPNLSISNSGLVILRSFNK